MSLNDAVVDRVLKIALAQKKVSNDGCLYLQHPTYTKSKMLKSALLRGTETIRVVVTSDTHNLHEMIGSVPECDIFVHCGDILMVSRLFSDKAGRQNLVKFNEWMSRIPAKIKIVIGGNHDNALEKLGKDAAKQLFSHCTYLENEVVTVEGYTIFATPYSNGSSKNKAFQSHACHDEALATCPDKVDILITHGHFQTLEQRTSHKVHLWGHNHNSYGVQYPGGKVHGSLASSLSVCATAMDGMFNLAHDVIVLDLPKNPAELSIPAVESVSVKSPRGGSSKKPTIEGTFVTEVSASSACGMFKSRKSPQKVIPI